VGVGLFGGGGAGVGCRSSSPRLEEEGSNPFLGATYYCLLPKAGAASSHGFSNFYIASMRSVIS